MYDTAEPGATLVPGEGNWLMTRPMLSHVVSTAEVMLPWSSPRARSAEVAAALVNPCRLGTATVGAQHQICQ
jgi:hypothetical protein